MSEEPSLSDLAARVLQRAEHAGSSTDDRDAHLALLAATVREERARSARRRWVTAAVAIAAVAVAAIGLRSVLKSAPGTTGPQADVASAKYDVRVEAGEAVRAGDHVQGKQGGVAVLVATGTRLTLDPGADVSLVEGGRTQIFALASGSVRADVAKLHEGERFLVRTVDTEVEVRGTSFRVERLDTAPTCHAELHTRVVVSEGVVVVRRAGVEDRVKAGEVWPPPCPAVPVESAAPVASTAPAVAPSAAPASSTSKLAAANALFAKAEDARKSGDQRAAVALFDRFLAEHPSSPLSEHATVERMRALDQVDRGRAVVAARDYLARYPHGFARAEAESILAISP